MADDARCSGKLDPRNHIRLVAYGRRHFGHRSALASHLPRMESSQAGRDSGVVLGMKLSVGEAADRLGNRSLLTDVGCLTSPSFLHEPKATETSFNSPVQPI
jgi:hypothetical protein